MKKKFRRNCVKSFKQHVYSKSARLTNNMKLIFELTKCTFLWLSNDLVYSVWHLKFGSSSLRLQINLTYANTRVPRITIQKYVDWMSTIFFSKLTRLRWLRCSFEIIKIWYTNIYYFNPPSKQSITLIETRIDKVNNSRCLQLSMIYVLIKWLYLPL